jgi:hypothetical protein
MRSTPSTAATVPDSELCLAADLLRGAAPIAKFVFGDDPRGRAKVYYLAGEVPLDQRLPVFRLGSQICARKSTLLRWIAEREGRAA